MKRNRLKLFFILFFTGSLLLAFQNCAKLKPEEIVCESNSAENCSLANAQSSPISLSLSQAKVEIYADDLNLSDGIFESYQIDLATDSVSTLGKPMNCSLAGNADWQHFKSLMLNHGICQYSYSIPPGTAVCMAMAMPYARIMNEGDKEDEGVFLSTSICSQSHNEVCGAENVQAFRQALANLKNELAAGKACD